MPDFLFPGGQAWVLHDFKEIAIADLEGGDVGLLLFTDEDLASAYAEKMALGGKPPKAIIGYSGLLALFKHLKELGITHVVVDHTPGRPAPAGEIDKAIADVEKQL